MTSAPPGRSWSLIEGGDLITIDASVLVAAGAVEDAAHDPAAEFLVAALRSGVSIHQPTLTFVEVGAAVARRTADPQIAAASVAELLRLPGLVMHSLDLAAAAEAAALAGQTGLRGADAVYAATAMRTGSMLVTLDRELLERVGPAVTSMTPADWIRASAGPGS